MPPLVIVLVYALAVARVTRLITADRLTEGPRDRLISRIWQRAWDRDNIPGYRTLYPKWTEADYLAHARNERRDAQAAGAEPPLLAYLIGCPWCASIYVGAVAAPLVYWLGESPGLLVPALALALSHLTGLLAKIGE